MKFSFLDSIITSLVAMVIVFALLIFLQYVIKLQTLILNLFTKKNQDSVKPEIIEKEEIIEDRSQDDLEIVAIIAAALSAYLDVPESCLKIKSIKRVNNNSSWGTSAIENNLKA